MIPQLALMVENTKKEMAKIQSVTMMFLSCLKEVDDFLMIIIATKIPIAWLVVSCIAVGKKRRIGKKVTKNPVSAKRCDLFVGTTKKNVNEERKRQVTLNKIGE